MSVFNQRTNRDASNAVEQLEDDLEAARDEIENLKSMVSELEAQIEALEGAAMEVGDQT